MGDVRMFGKTPEEMGILSLFVPGLDSFVYMEPESPMGLEPEQRSLEYELEHCGKLIVYGTQGYVKDLSEKLKIYLTGPMGGPIDYMKYSTEPVMLSKKAAYRWSYDRYALCVYCSDEMRPDVERLLAEHGVAEYDWKMDRESWINFLKNPQARYNMMLLNFDKLKEVSSLLGMDEEFGIERLADIKSDIAKTSSFFREASKMLKDGMDIDEVADSPELEQKYGEMAGMLKRGVAAVESGSKKIDIRS